MFSGLELKASDKKVENDQQQQQTEAPSRGGSSFSFLQSSISSSAVTEDPTPSLSAPPAPSGGSSFSFLSSSSAAAKTTDTSSSIPVSTPAAPSGFSFLSNTSNSAPAPAPEPELVEESQTYMAPTATSSSATSTSMSAFGFLSSTPSSEPKPSPAPAKESSSSMFSFLSSSITTESPAPAPAPVPTSAPLDLTGMTPSATTSSSSTKKSEPWGGTSSSDSKPVMSTGGSGSDILSLANPHQPAGSGIVFGTAAVKKQGIKKRSKTKKVGYTATASAASPSTPALTPTSKRTIPSLPEPAPPQSSTSASFTTLPSVDSAGDLKQTHSQEEATKRLAQEAEDAARKAEQFMREKLSSSPPTIVTGRYSNNDVTEDYGGGAEVSSSSLEPPSSPVGDETYEAAKAAAQEAQNVAAAAAGKKSGTGSVGFMGLFKRSSGGGGGNISSANSISSPSPSSHGANGSRHGSGKDDGEDAKKKIEEGLRKVETDEEQEREEQERLKLEAMKLEEERLEKQRNERMAREEAERLEKERQEEEKRKQPILTPQKKLTFLLLEFKSRTDRAVDRVARLRQQRSALLAERATAEKQLELATQQITQAEKQQMAAAEEEDFDLADRLAQVIERYEKEKDDEKSVLKSIDDSIEKVDELSDDVVDSVAQCFVEVQGLLTDFAEEEGGKEKEDGTEVVAKFEVVAKRLAAENERLSADWKNIERDGGFVEEERKELEGTISEQTQDYQVLRDIACKKLAVVDSEVEELKRQLAIKEAEAFQLSKEVSTHNETIAQVRTKFARQLTRLGKKESALSESRKEWETEKLAFTNMKDEHEAEVTAHSEAVIAHDKIMARIKVEVSAAKLLESVIRKEIIVEKSGQSSYTHDGEGAVSNGIDSELAEYHAEVVKREAAVDEANQKLEDAQIMIENLEREIAAIDERIPELEAEKKTSAAKRDFKSASKASKEIKEVTAKKKLCQEELEGEALDRREAARVELEKISAELEEKKKVAHEKEKEIGKKQMVILAKKIWRLVEMKKEIIANTAVDDVDEDENTSVTTIGISVLDSEIATMITEGTSLGEKFDGWEDILEQVEEEIGGEEEEIEEKNDEVVDESTEAKDENTENDDINGEPSSTINAEESEDELEENEELNGEVENGVSMSNNINFEAVSRYKEIIAQQKKFEGDLDDAVVAEDYDQAAEIDEKLQELKGEINSLGLTQTELDLANEKDVESKEQEVVENLGENKDEQTDRSGDIVEEIESDGKGEMNDDS